MNQQINLYRPPQSTRVAFSATTSTLIFLLSTLLMAAIYGYNRYALQQMESQLAVLEQAQSRLAQQFDRARETLAVPEPSPQLQAQLRSMEGELRSKRQFQQLLAGLQSQQRLPFSGLLLGLTEQTVDGLWLTRIQASTQARQLRLEGEALQGVLVPRYLQRLGAAAGFQRARFDELQLRESAQGLSFQLSARLQAGDGA